MIIGWSMSKVGVSAQFGGRDAAEAALPHLRALNAAARGLHLEYFPFAGLDVILRVDGDVRRFGEFGAGRLQIGEDGDYVAVDIVVGLEDRGRILEVITEALRSSVGRVGARTGDAARGVDLEALKACLIVLADRYEEEIGRGGRVPPEDRRE